MGSIEPTRFGLKEPSEDARAVADIRKLIIDCCRQYVLGHGGGAIGMAPMAVALWAHEMRYSNNDPEWYDRDRFVLSNGHTAIILYVMLYFAGYSSVTMDDLKLYASPLPYDRESRTAPQTNCSGHPENHVPGIEVTTGPLGQGIANAVGMAIVSKQQAAQFNRPAYKMISSRIYCTTGDACLQEGVALEAISIAGHLGLDNLVLLYDNNAITCDGPLSWIDSEDVNLKMQSCGWNVIDVFDGDNSVDDIVSALNLARSCKGKPTFINIRTTIGYGTSSAGTSESHHGMYDQADAEHFALYPNQPPHSPTEATKQYLASAADRGNIEASLWASKLQDYSQKYPEQAAALRRRMEGQLDYQEMLETMEAPHHLPATRESNGWVFGQLIHRLEGIFAGGADVWGPNKLADCSDLIFDRNNRQGRVIRYGIREHAMAAISNGIAAYSRNAFVPVTATFFMFYLYAAAGVRMGALNRLQVIHIATHDSLNEGKNGPTHQPVELDSLYRAMPSLLYIRPCDAEEVIGAWMVALGERTKSSIISVAREGPQTRVPNTNRHKVGQGGYVILEADNAQVTLISTGSELQFAVEAAQELCARGIPTRVVSMPCIELFEEQSDSYKEQVISSSPHVISIEPYVPLIWARYCTASIGTETFGFSASGTSNYARYGLDGPSVTGKVLRHLQDSTEGRSRRAVKWKILANAEDQAKGLSNGER
ncbi:Transketolase, domain-containing protein [Cladophialophora immunda]|nr:Transketolase, domain-containing protein [Cladophialophora immunda]